MSEVSQDEFEKLKARVAELEQRLDEEDASPSGVNRTGTDHRDAAVIESLQVGKDYTPRQTVRKYKRATDIVNSKTAKERAKRLRSKECFEGNTFVGWSE